MTTNHTHNIILKTNISIKDIISLNKVGTAKKIVDIIIANRKTTGESCNSESYCHACSNVLLEKIIPLVNCGEKINFIIPAFPFPMQNKKKTFASHLPDHAELLSLKHLKKICDDIKEIYSPGARFIIATDGDVFVPVQTHWYPMDEDVPTKYVEGLKKIISSIDAEEEFYIWGLRDAYDYTDVNMSREKLLNDYSISIDETRERITKPNTVENLGYIGLKRYLISDGLDSSEGAKLSSRTVKKISGELAVQATHLAEAWSHCLAKRFPRAIRLSVHPYPAHFEGKTGIKLTGGKEEWGTPWHAVAVYYSMTGEWEIMKNHKAQELGGILINNIDGHPDYYIINSFPDKLKTEKH